MRRLIALLVCILCLGVTHNTLAKNVVVSGFGSTVVEAENDALRMAVENTLGVLVDSQTIVDKSVVVEDNIYAKSKGFVRDYKVISKKQDYSGWHVTIDAIVDTNPDSKLMSELTRLGLIDNMLRNPKIAIIIDEKHVNYRIPNATSETAIVNKFIESGFDNMVDINKDRLMHNNPFAMTAEELENLARSMQADILIVGQAFSEGVGDVGKFLPGSTVRTGVKSCRARTEAKMYISRTGQIIAAHGFNGAGADLTEAVAAKVALQNAGEQIGEYLVEKLLGFAARNRKQLEVIVLATDFAKMNEVKSALTSVYGVRDAQVTGYSNGRAVIRVQYAGAPQTLFNLLQESGECNVELRTVTYNTLTILAK